MKWWLLNTGQRRERRNKYFLLNITMLYAIFYTNVRSTGRKVLELLKIIVKNVFLIREVWWTKKLTEYVRLKRRRDTSVGTKVLTAGQSNMWRWHDRNGVRQATGALIRQSQRIGHFRAFSDVPRGKQQSPGESRHGNLTGIIIVTTGGEGFKSEILCTFDQWFSAFYNNII